MKDFSYVFFCFVQITQNDNRRIVALSIHVYEMHVQMNALMTNINLRVQKKIML